MLILGPSGSGKTSILRVLLDVWRIESGSIFFKFKQKENDGSDSISYMKLSADPIFVPGTLVDQIMYPVQQSTERYPGDHAAERKKLLSIISLVGLESLVARNMLEQTLFLSEWYQLSPGERQRIGFARLFYHRPAFASKSTTVHCLFACTEETGCTCTHLLSENLTFDLVLDEAANSLDEETEATLFKLCKLYHIQLLTISHRSSAMQYHHLVLQLDKQHMYTLTTTARSSAK
jgi:ABC-type uncharacterized transport system fused permease/ATPase subunit